jgi:hypothetical protein
LFNYIIYHNNNGKAAQGIIYVTKIFLQVYLKYFSLSIRSRDSSIGIVTGYGLEGWGRAKRFFFTSQRRNRLWGPFNLRELFPLG